MYNIPIEQVIKNQITVQDYFDLMHQLLIDLDATRQDGWQIILDKSRMSIKDGRLARELDEVNGPCEMSVVKDFLKNLTFDCIFQLNENCAAVTKFLQMTDSVSEVNFIRVMIQFCESQLGIAETQGARGAYTGNPVQQAQPQVAQQPQMVPQPQMASQPQMAPQPQVAPQIQMPPQPQMPPQGWQGGNDGETGVLSEDFWDMLNQQSQYAGQPARQNQYAGQPAQQNQYAGQPMQQGRYSNQPGGQGSYAGYEPAGSNGETGVLDPNFWQQIQGAAAPNAGAAMQRRASGRLVNAKTGVVTVINKDNFWIGKGDVDLKIEKDTVSRKHAQILTRQNHYFISDNGSTNKTYVEGKEIAPNASVELYNGMHVKFANEEYVFQL